MQTLLGLPSPVPGPEVLRAKWLTTALKTWVKLNIQLCDSITPSYVRETSAFALFRMRVVTAVLDLSPKVVVDIGAGRQWHQHPALKQMAGFKLIGVDIDPEEMTKNHALDEQIVSDVTQSINLPPDCADLVTVRSGVEHFRDNGAFLRNLYFLLRPGGRAVMVFPNRFAPFAVLNRILPRRVAMLALRALVPGSEGVLGFEAHYDRTSYTQFKKLAENSGFNVLNVSRSYYSSNYFRFFAPLYLFLLILDHLRYLTAIKSLASFYTFTLEKPEVKFDPH
ncbi:MAG TPA: methyltransferase domain-containing protein [Alphaproteobacteria bacterium]|nr:methyltransferase domain-containing protein [Alphaproteobacteria bacterium]